VSRTGRWPLAPATGGGGQARVPGGAKYRGAGGRPGRRPRWPGPVAWSGTI